MSGGKEEKKQHAGAAHGLPQAEPESKKRLKVVTRKELEAEEHARLAQGLPRQQPFVFKQPEMTPRETADMYGAMFMAYQLDTSLEPLYKRLEEDTLGGRKWPASGATICEGRDLFAYIERLMEALITYGRAEDVAKLMKRMHDRGVGFSYKSLIFAATRLNFPVVTQLIAGGMQVRPCTMGDLHVLWAGRPELRFHSAVVRAMAIVLLQRLDNKDLEALSDVVLKCPAEAWMLLEGAYADLLPRGFEIMPHADTLGVIGMHRDPLDIYGRFRRENYTLYDGLLEDAFRYEGTLLHQMVGQCRLTAKAYIGSLTSYRVDAAGRPIVTDERALTGVLVELVAQYLSFNDAVYARTPHHARRYTVMTDLNRPVITYEQVAATLAEEVASKARAAAGVVVA